MLEHDAVRLAWNHLENHDFTGEIADDDWSEIPFVQYLDDQVLTNKQFSDLTENDKLHLAVEAVKRRFILYLLKRCGIRPNTLAAVESELEPPFPE